MELSYLQSWSNSLYQRTQKEGVCCQYVLLFRFLSHSYQLRLMTDDICGLYYKHMAILNDDSRVIIK
jgi:hypothetical protein